MSQTRLLECTASALVLRELPAGTDTGLRIINGQVAVSHGVSHDGRWAYVEAPAGVGWSSLAYLEETRARAPHSSYPPVPHGLVQIRELFGESGGPQCYAGKVQLPAPLPLSWDPATTVTRFGCHELVKAPMQAAFDEVYRRGLWEHLEDYGGCFNVRRARGLTKLSTHSWGIAVDVAVRNNPLSRRPVLDARIVAIFEDVGFTWGGRWSRPDGMHFQWATGY